MSASLFEETFTENQAMLSAQLLLRHGYEVTDAATGSFLKVVDDQHGLLAFVSAKRFPSRSDERGNLSVRFGLARRDVNEHLELWRPDLVNGFVRKPWSPTVTELASRPFASAETLKLAFRDSFDSFAPVLEDALVSLEDWADLEHFELLLYEDDHIFSKLWDRVVNDALSGRDERSRSAYEMLSDGAQQAETAPEWRQMFEAFDVAYQKFRRDFPDGIR